MIEDLDLPAHIVVDDTTHPLASNLCGMSRPERLVAFLVDGLSTDEEGGFSPEAFAPGAAQGLFAVVSREEGERSFHSLSSYLRGKRAVKALAGQECEAAVALWPLSDDKVALLVIDANTSAIQNLQEVWEETARVLRFGAYEDGRVLAADRFDPQTLVGAATTSSDVVEGLQQLRSPAPAPATRTRRTPAAP